MRGNWRLILTWAGLACLILAPLVAASFSPLLAWRSPIYIAAGFAGILAMGLLVLQPLLAMRLVPDIAPHQARKLHRIIGVLIVAAVIAHVAGLWLTSPPDVVDALLFVSPTPFSPWGVVAMWALFATASVAIWRKSLKLRPKQWRAVHVTLSTIVIAGTSLHALLVDGTMESVTKALLSATLLTLAVVILNSTSQARKN